MAGYAAMPLTRPTHSANRGRRRHAALLLDRYFYGFAAAGSV